MKNNNEYKGTSSMKMAYTGSSADLILTGYGNQYVKSSAKSTWKFCMILLKHWLSALREKSVHTNRYTCH
jgi:hypothetical protein